MPKKKEVHLKKLIKGGEEPHKEEDTQVRHVPYQANWRNQNHNLSYHTGTRTWRLELSQMISRSRLKGCKKLPSNVFPIFFWLILDIHLFFKDGQRSYYPIVQICNISLTPGFRKRFLAFEGSYARNQLDNKIPPSAYWSLSYFCMSILLATFNGRAGSSRFSRRWTIHLNDSKITQDHSVKLALEQRLTNLRGCWSTLILSSWQLLLLYFLSCFKLIVGLHSA